MTCVALRRAMQDKDEAQMCARGTFSVWIPVSVAEVVKAAFRAARAAAKRWLAAGECLVTLAEQGVEAEAAERARLAAAYEQFMSTEPYSNAQRVFDL